MAFLAKQFTSLLLLLIISRLILSTHAVRQHFSQFGRMTTTTAATTDSTDKKPDFSQPAFYENTGERNGLGTSNPSTSTSFLPSNYDPEMYTTSKETQKNMYQKNDAPSKEENYGAYNPFSNSKYDEQYNANKKPTTTETKKQTEEPGEFYYKDTSSNVYTNQQTQSSKPFSSSSKFNQRYNQDNQFYQKDPYYSPQDEEPYEAKKYDPYGSQQYIEAAEEEEKKKKKPTTTVVENQYGYKYNPFQQANYDPTESKKQSNSKYDEQYTTVAEKYANEDAELDAFLNEQENKQVAPNTPSYKFSKNSVPAQSYSNTKKDTNNDWKTWQAYDQKQHEKDNKYADSETYGNTKKDTTNDWEAWQAYGQKQEKDNKYADSETYRNTKKDTNNEWSAYYQKKDDDKHFAMTDAELNAILDEEEKQDENEIGSPPQGMSDTRAESNQQYYQPYKWQEHTEDFATAFTGNALTNAMQNNP